MKALPQSLGMTNRTISGAKISYELFEQDKYQTGGIAQLGERLICIQEVIGSIPFTSTILNEGV